MLRIVNVNAVSLDGSIGGKAIESDEERKRYGFTNSEDKEHVRTLLEEADVVITGANSLRSAEKTWEVKNKKGKYVAWYVFSNKGLSQDLGFFKQSKIERTIVSKNPLATGTGVSNLVYGTEHPAEFLRSHLKSQNIERALLFGGGAINKLFFEKNLVDEVIVTLCPIILSTPDRAHYVNPGLTHPVHLQLESSIKNGNLVFLRYNVKN